MSSPTAPAASVAIPGKVMLSGEYIVLFGGDAVLVPAGRQLRVAERSDPGPDDSNPVLRETLAQPIPELAEFEADHPLLHLAVDRSQFQVTGSDGRPRKLGLGGSAAEAVGGIAMRFQRAGVRWQDQPRRVFELADDAHRRAQGGVGSGADVAACAYRRPIRFRRLPTGDAMIEPIVPPTPEVDLPLALLWTGVPANTRHLVQPFLQWASSEEAASRIDALREAAHDLAVGWFSVQPAELFERMDRFVARMQAAAIDAGVPWTLPVHDELARWAHEHGGRAKPTGAGGGDLVLMAGELPVADRDELHLALDPFGS